MRQHLSVLMLAARSTIYKVLGLFVLTALAESALFCLNLQKTLAGEPLGLEQLISESRIALVCGASFLLLCALLSLTGCEMGGSKLRYTLQRLSVGEETIVLWWALYNAICFFLFWALHVVIVLLLSRLYVVRMDAAYVTDQTILLAFYRNNWLHSLLPLAETSRYVRNISLVLGLGISAACFSYQQRRGKRETAIVALAMLVVTQFSQPMGSYSRDWLLTFIALIVSFFLVLGIWKGRGLDA
ncbi:MAG: hypothetical protein GX033_02310 [Firmicutes bacterium]|nr:hypothetical protein [Bacillota bacterium]